MKDEEHQKRPEIKIQIPDSLKLQLVDDWEYITKDQLLVPLPRKPNVIEILEEYRAWQAGRDARSRSSPAIVQEVVVGLKTYFDKSLGNNLLYKYERQQLVDMRKRILAEKEGNAQPAPAPPPAAAAVAADVKGKGKAEEGEALAASSAAAPAPAGATPAEAAQGAEAAAAAAAQGGEGVAAAPQAAPAVPPPAKKPRRRLIDNDTSLGGAAPSEIYGAEHLLRLFGESSLCSLSSFVVMEGKLNSRPTSRRCSLPFYHPLQPLAERQQSIYPA